MTHNDTCVLARNMIYVLIDQLKSQSGLSQKDATLLMVGYAVELAAFVTDDPEALLADCEQSIAKGLAVKHAFMPKNREPANPTEGATL